MNSFLDQTPKEIDEHVIKLVNKISPGATPFYVPVIPEIFSIERECFPNVERKVSESGGKSIFGWQIWKGQFLVEAEFHAIWCSPSGELIDITPKEIKTEKILFLQDNQKTYTGASIDNIRLALTNNELVGHFIAISELIFELENSNGREKQSGFISLQGEEARAYQVMQMYKINILALLHQNGSIYSRCFCGGSDTYVNCCGKVFSRV